MNRLVVRQAAAGLGTYLLDNDSGGSRRRRGVSSAYDARRKSDVFAARHRPRASPQLGIPVRCCSTRWCRRRCSPGRSPRWTAVGGGRRHRVAQPARRQRLQGVPRRRRPDRATARHRHRRVASIAFDPTTVELAARDDRADHQRRRRSWIEATSPPLRRSGRRPDVPGVPVAYTAMHGVGGAVLLAGVRRRRLARSRRGRRPARTRRHVPDGVVPEPGGTGGDGPAARDGGRPAAPTWHSPTTPTPIGSARRSRSPTAPGVGSAATRSAGCSPTTSWTTPTATTAS